VTSSVQRLLQSIRKEIPQALAEGQDHDDAEVAAMLRELGIALVECGAQHHPAALRDERACDRRTDAARRSGAGHDRHPVPKSAPRV
jgi:hypothetical protein